MPIVDDFGVWEGLGTVVPAFDWQLFPLFPSTPNAAFRVFYIGDFDRTWYPPAFVRGVYFSGSQYFFDRNWVKLYPKNEPEIIQIPYPADLQSDPLPQRQIEIKLARRYHYADLSVNGYTVELFEKVSSNVVYPTSPATPGNVQGGGNSSGNSSNYPPGLL
ncbi:hypothetical protein Lepto7376_3714 [[Leptolyngbya] sp. PCC 7376]|uniref:hypothetical protein n=1 Tax=[Leptolyngbya] sp. PCC 7376 TaxID=111781 RepID=UPI00029ED009|nr:hypothetical protein [[Leptolyngbya] sp. PCC 7376]AFY39890.1 hypothetical protein Lepto7376_3714 [[Leptolyngbya] sp. PCC 7376]